MKRLMNTPFAQVACWLGAAVLVGLSGCGGGGGGADPVTPPVVTPPREGALAASKPGELMDYVRSKLDARAAEVQKNPGMVFVPSIGSVLSVGITSAAATNGATSVERSGTTVQEIGVDEDDLLKTDGNVLYTLSAATALGNGLPGATLKTYRRRADGGIDAAGALPTIVEAEAMAAASGMLLSASAQRVAVLGQSQQFLPFDFCVDRPVCTLPAFGFAPVYGKPAVHLDLVNVGNAAAPLLAERVRIDGRLIGARLIGTMLYLVTQHTPQLALEALPATATKADRDALLARLGAADVLPHVRIGSGAATPLVADTDCYVQAKNTSLGIDITTITAIDLAAGISSRASRCFVGGSEALYMSTSSLYLATTRTNYNAINGLIRFPSTMSTDLHKFALAGLSINYRGSGEVPGHLGWDAQRKSYRMSEFNGDLRVLSYTGETGWAVPADAGTVNAPPPSPAALTILRERTSDQTLQVVGKLPSASRPAAIGKPGEQVYAVRFLGNRGYVVTFRRTDPLYVLDLADAADPKAVGELETPGFSDYLLPLANNLLLGVGRDADARGMATGAKVSLYDVANPAAPREVASRVFGAAGSGTGLDASSHGIDLFTRGNLTRVGLPLRVVDAKGFISARGLQKIEIDTSARSMSLKDLLPASDGVSNWDLSRERSVQIENHVYYLSGSALTAKDW
jgi:Beta propeller domain